MVFVLAQGCPARLGCHNYRILETEVSFREEDI